MYHSFNVEIAAKFGIESAVILNFLEFWISKNKANEKHFHDGRYWTYNSNKAMLEIFPYMTENIIRKAVKRLVDGGILVTGNYNEDKWDRTLWYAITEFGYSILKNPEKALDDKKRTNAFVQENKSSCATEQMDVSQGTNDKDINNNININNSSIHSLIPVNKNNICASEDAPSENEGPVEEVKNPTTEELEKHFEALWKLYPLKKGKGSVSWAKKKYLFNISLEEWERAIDRYLEYVKNANFDLQLMHGSTFCNSGHVDYLDKNYLTEDQEEKVPEVAKEPEEPVDYGWGDD